MNIDPPPVMTVRDVIDLTGGDLGSVLAGTSGLDRRVSAVNIVEVPDVHRWLVGGEFLFTSGYPWMDRPDEFRRAIHELDRAGAAGIGIKLGDYLREVPPEVLADADAVAFPVLQLPDHPYMDIIEPLYARMTARRQWTLERSIEARGAFRAEDSDRYSVETIASSLAGETGNTAYLVDADGGGCLAVAPGSEPERLTLEQRPVAALAARAAIENGTGMTPARFEIDGTAVVAAAFGDERQGQGPSIVVVTDDVTPFTDATELMVRDAAGLLSFVVFAQASRTAGRREAGRLFLGSLLAEDLTPEEAAERALDVGLSLSRPCVAMLVGQVAGDADHRALIHSAISRALADRPFVASDTGDDVLVVAQPRPRTDAERASSLGRELTTAILERLAGSPVDQPIVACGRLLTGLEGLRRSVQEASTAIQSARQQGTHGALCFEDLGLDRVLCDCPVDPITQWCIERGVGPVLEDPELLRTLRVFLDSGGCKVDTARAIPVHRSSLTYRLRKISSILDVDLDDPDERFGLWLTLRLHDFIEVRDRPITTVGS